MTKIGFFSDVHGNLEALTAILKRLDQLSCDLLVCLGDIVGYGANPSECIQIIRERDIPCVMGNHDEYASSYMTPSVARLRPEILQSIEWTQTQLSLEDRKWLAEQPKRLQLGEALAALHPSLAHAVLQWIRGLPRLLQRLADALHPGALLAVTSFGPQNLREIAALTGRGLHYHDLQTWQRLLQPHFSLLHADEHLHQLPFHSPLDVLRHLRQTGVTATASSSTPPWTRTQLNDFSQRYRQRFRLPDGDLPLTYHPLTLIARRLPN